MRNRSSLQQCKITSEEILCKRTVNIHGLINSVYSCQQVDYREIPSCKSCSFSAACVSVLAATLPLSWLSQHVPKKYSTRAFAWNYRSRDTNPIFTANGAVSVRLPIIVLWLFPSATVKRSLLRYIFWAFPRSMQHPLMCHQIFMRRTELFKVITGRSAYQIWFRAC